MALVTRCPTCRTTYKVYPEQLQMQNGFVRCGECRTIFNGFATLITADESDIEYPATVAQQSAVLSQPDAILTVDESLLVPDEIRARMEDEGDKAGVRALSADAADGSVTASDTDAQIEPDDGFLSDKRPPKTREYWAWLAASVGLCVVLVGQGVHAYRAELVQAFPQHRPLLETFCKTLGCTLPLPEAVQLLSIIHSDLEVRDPELHPDVLALTAIIRNHASFSQALPIIKLSLTDAHNELLASRMFSAEEYLSAEQNGLTAIQRGQELVVQLYLDNGNLKSTGYRVELLY